jgi:hypothetical protein
MKIAKILSNPIKLSVNIFLIFALVVVTSRLIFGPQESLVSNPFVIINFETITATIGLLVAFSIYQWGMITRKIKSPDHLAELAVMICIYGISMTLYFYSPASWAYFFIGLLVIIAVDHTIFFFYDLLSEKLVESEGG